MKECKHYDNWCEKEKRSCKDCYWDNDFDFIVGFTLFTPKGFKTMYRHFPTLEMAKMFASNVNIKNNCKIYVDFDFYDKVKTENMKLKNCHFKYEEMTGIDLLLEE